MMALLYKCLACQQQVYCDFTMHEQELTHLVKDLLLLLWGQCGVQRVDLDWSNLQRTHASQPMSHSKQ